jgi:hypothetical protein
MARGSGKTGLKIVGLVIATASLVLCVEQYLSYGQEEKRIGGSELSDLKALIVNTGGRKARLYKRLA